MSKGIIIFATNNGLLDYIKIACTCAGYVRKNLSGFDEIALVTNNESLLDNEELVNKYFDRTIISASTQDSNIRLFKDTAQQSQYAPFVNMSRSDIYDLSPYEESLVIDCDYFVMSSTLDQVWGSENDFMINCQYRDVAGRHGGNVSYIDDFSIPMYWATVFYFRKSEYTENLFTLVSHIKENYKYYYYLYNCSGTLFRNDFAFSMAVHILNGQVACQTPSLPIDYLNNSFDLDDIFRVNSANDIIMYCAKPEKTTEHILARFTNTDIHIMNKSAIQRNIDVLLAQGDTL
jgi:hypothetical protein|tara:strand:- start:33700 stop:34569 length:870 start_codon:yes stop_codon:yes gene_type:complete